MSEYGFYGDPPPQPSSKDCTAKRVTKHNERQYLACWYPQMGGYGSRCMVELPTEKGGCFEAFIWHDGSFPFDTKDVGTDSFGDGTVRQPAHIHHCSVDQFTQFATDVNQAAL
ncbi:hypothetical protein LCGC14_0375030 [marine sediment metagenome]|uniref:Uncharacterized protein n=1 Tax=marine sediment metagenome TaxID=412755 RepID=A0A0F9VR55_9ZZZZ